MPSEKQSRRSGPHDPARLFVDSGAWLALPSPRDQHHRRAVGLFRTAIEREIQLLTTNLVLAEVHRLVLFRNGPRAAAARLASIAASPLLTIVYATSAHHEAALGWLSRLSSERISYTDAISFALMNANRCEAALGFDNDFIVAGFALWDP